MCETETVKERKSDTINGGGKRETETLHIKARIGECALSYQTTAKAALIALVKIQSWVKRRLYRTFSYSEPISQTGMQSEIVMKRLSLQSVSPTEGGKLLL